jgi:hypothetical protein
MQAARSKPSTAPQLVRGDKATIVTKNFFLCGQSNRKLRDRQLGPSAMDEQIGKHNYRLKIPTTVRLHPMFHVNNLYDPTLQLHS